MPRFAPVLAFAGLALITTGASLRADDSDKFRAGLATKVQALEKNNTAATTGVDGWLFVTSELRMLSVGKFWGADAAKVSRSLKPENADPLPAILDFNKQLKDRDITLIVVPVPPKAEIYPEKIASDLLPPSSGTSMTADVDPMLADFYAELAHNGVDVLDLRPSFSAERVVARTPVFCQTDTHWSGFGCVRAAELIAREIRAKVSGLPASSNTYHAEWKDVVIDGDLGAMLETGAKKPGTEKVLIRQLDTALVPDPNSPILLLGDSHTLVFHDFLAERAGLFDQLAVEIGIVPDRIAIRGSGATPVRIDLYRRSVKDPAFLAKKKVIIWCFTAREFTEAAQGWQKLPVAK